MQTIDFSKITFKDNDRILDLGCGEGRHSIGAAYHEAKIEVFAIDLSFTDIKSAKSKHQSFDSDGSNRTLYCQANGHVLPFADHSFDHIVCSEVLEHIPDYQGILKEIDRILKPGGTLNISVPRYWPEKICWALSREYHEVEGGHIRIFESAALAKEVQKRSYTFVRRHWAHSLHAPYWWLRCASWSRGENFFLTRIYHKFLVWDLLEQPWLTRILDKVLNPIMGKSVVMYFLKPKGDNL